MSYEPTDQEKAAALWPHVYNEIDQLVRVLDCPCNDRTLQNARIESIAVHVRCLLDFFGKAKRFQDDVLASDYCFDGTYTNEEVRERANKDINHLTYTRLKNYPENSQWNPTELIRLLAICGRFVAHILRERPTMVGFSDWQDLGLRLEAACARHQPAI